jgi:hypothetical protein
MLNTKIKPNRTHPIMLKIQYRKRIYHMLKHNLYTPSTDFSYMFRIESMKN